MSEKKRDLLDWGMLEKGATILKAVAHPMRLRIVELLEKGEMTVSELQDALEISQSLASQQLGLMKDRGVLRSRREGNQVYYSIAIPEVLQVINCIRKIEKKEGA